MIQLVAEVGENNLTAVDMGWGAAYSCPPTLCITQPNDLAGSHLCAQPGLGR